MSANFYELLKYAATGQASPDMTYYDKLRASTLMGGVVRTLTGQPPLTFKADGSPLISWSMKGNGQQTGTPTPDNPVMPEFVGVRTGNLCDSGDVTIALHERYKSIPISLEQGVYTLSFEYKSENTGTATVIFYNETTIIQSLNVTITNDKGTASITSTQPITAIRLYSASGYTPSYDYAAEYTNIMLNAGSTAMHYEPYGYKIPLTCAGQTVPVYLGQTQTVRRIKKLVLTGNETWRSSGTYTGAVYAYHSQFPGIKPLTPIFCTHLVDAYESSYVQGTCKNDSNSVGLWVFDTATSPTTFKEYLAQQYTAGTPVTVWYVLATPETAIINEPLCKIGTYADELSSEDAGVTIPTVKGSNTLTVDTPIQPSEMTITFKG